MIWSHITESNSSNNNINEIYLPDIFSTSIDMKAGIANIDPRNVSDPDDEYAHIDVTNIEYIYRYLMVLCHRNYFYLI